MHQGRVVIDLVHELLEDAEVREPGRRGISHRAAVGGAGFVEDVGIVDFGEDVVHEDGEARIAKLEGGELGLVGFDVAIEVADMVELALIEMHGVFRDGVAVGIEDLVATAILPIIIGEIDVGASKVHAIDADGVGGHQGIVEGVRHAIVIDVAIVEGAKQ